MEVCIPMPTRSDATGGKYAFLVMAHKDNEVLHTLMRALDNERNDIFIPMDAKSGWKENRLLAFVSKTGIFLIPRIRVTWGAYSQIACELNFLNSAVAKGHYSYSHLLSGQDLSI